MSIKRLGTLFLLLATGMFMGCAKPQIPLEFTPQAFETGKYAPKVDNFQVIIDASESMDVNMFGEQEFPTARNFVASLNQSIPTDLTYNAGLRSFGHHPKQCKNLTALPYGMTTYSRAGFAAGLDSIKKLGGNSPLSAALIAASHDLKSAPGNSAIIVVSDGVAMEDAPAAAALVNAEMGDRLCVYTVQAGDSAEGRKTLCKVAKAFNCGQAVKAADLTAPGKFAEFVETVLLAPAKAKALPVLDSDGDGVPNSRDKCPNTPKGVMVDKDGCEIKHTLQLEFDTDSSKIRPVYHTQIAKAADFIKSYPATKVLIAGHTDSVGKESYNKALSMRRADSLKNYLVSNFGVNPGQLFTRGYGENRPIATNDTVSGRQANRRIELFCCTVLPED